MSEDARTPGTPRDADSWTPTGQGNGWTAPGDGENGTRGDHGARWVDDATGEGPQYAVSGESGESGERGARSESGGPVTGERGALGEGAGAGEQARPPAERASAEGPGSVQSPADRAPADGTQRAVPAQAGEPFAAPARTPAPPVSLGKPGTDRQPEPNPWAPPQETDASGGNGRGGGNGTPAPAHGLPTITSFPGAGVPSGPTVPGGPAWDNPFAAPTAPTPYPQPGPGEPVPPPPIAPDGPGQVPYGYGYPQYPGAGPAAHGGVPGYGWPPAPPAPSNGMGTSSLVLGIIAAVLFCAWPLAILLGILAVIFGVIGRGKVRRGEATNPGQALAGIICGVVGIVLGAVLMVVVIAVPDDFGVDDSDGSDGFNTSLVTQQG
ncbi:DUF4190 domain-containing protein [Streptomyces sp. NPDC007084]|uniref:DUF4190 domain-containing protein n=1 Tax=Streptomyces sp. NPDC007084 TaxID=3154313 RepID=UPI0034544F23